MRQQRRRKRDSSAVRSNERDRETSQSPRAERCRLPPPISCSDKGPRGLGVRARVAASYDHTPAPHPQTLAPDPNPPKRKGSNGCCSLGSRSPMPIASSPRYRSTTARPTQSSDDGFVRPAAHRSAAQQLQLLLSFAVVYPTRAQPAVREIGLKKDVRPTRQHPFRRSSGRMAFFACAVPAVVLV